VKAEFSKTPHARGVVSMARSANPDSASSQFFIVVADSPHLDNQYSAFGKVASGLDVVDKIVAEETDHRDNPLEPVSLTVKIVEE
jgi:peptidyl-prolyl cis-trans isomerase B (cyclophilin B)